MRRRARTRARFGRPTLARADPLLPAPVHSDPRGGGDSSLTAASAARRRRPSAGEAVTIVAGAPGTRRSTADDKPGLAAGATLSGRREHAGGAPSSTERAFRTAVPATTGRRLISPPAKHRLWCQSSRLRQRRPRRTRLRRRHPRSRRPSHPLRRRRRARRPARARHRLQAASSRPTRSGRRNCAATRHTAHPSRYGHGRQGQSGGEDPTPRQPL